MRVFVVLVFLIGISVNVSAQNRYTISGYIKDSLTGETLIGATLQVDNRSGAVSSNAYGFYSITLPEGTHDMACSFVGYDSRQFSIQLFSNKTLQLLLTPRISSSQE